MRGCDIIYLVVREELAVPDVTLRVPRLQVTVIARNLRPNRGFLAN